MLRCRPRRDEGIALVAAMMAMMLMLVLGMALMMATITETRIAQNHRDGIETLYAAEAGIDLAISDLRGVVNWNDLLTGDAQEPPDASGQGWRVYARGFLADRLPGTPIDPRIHVEVWVGSGRPENAGVLAIRSTAYGPRGTRRAIEATVKRIEAIDAPARAATIQRLSWRER